MWAAWHVVVRFTLVNSSLCSVVRTRSPSGQMWPSKPLYLAPRDSLQTTHPLQTHILLTLLCTFLEWFLPWLEFVVQCLLLPWMEDSKGCVSVEIYTQWSTHFCLWPHPAAVFELQKIAQVGMRPSGLNRFPILGVCVCVKYYQGIQVAPWLAYPQSRSGQGKYCFGVFILH